MIKLNMSIDKLISEVRADIQMKHDNGQGQEIDHEILAWVSVYYHGNEQFRKRAFKILRKFFSNSGYVRSERDVLETARSDVQLKLF